MAISRWKGRVAGRAGWLLLLLIVTAGLKAEADPVSVGPEDQSCGVRCAGVVLRKLHPAPPPVEEIRAALGAQAESVSLHAIQQYLESTGLFTVPCAWSGKAVADWKGNLTMIAHLSCKSGHFVVIEKDATGITVVDLPETQSFPAGRKGMRRWRAHVGRSGMTPTGLLVSDHPVQLPAVVISRRGLAALAPLLAVAILLLSAGYALYRCFLNPAPQNTESAPEDSTEDSLASRRGFPGCRNNSACRD
jgi:hypothetical protein